MGIFHYLSKGFLVSGSLILFATTSLRAQWSGATGPTGAVYREGNVGIGIGFSTPASLVHLLGGDLTLQYDGTTAANLLFTDAANATIGSIGATGSKIVMATGATGSTGAGITIDGSNNVGIGTSAPTAMLDVNGTLKASTLEITALNSPTHYQFKVAGYDIGKFNAYGLSIGINNPLGSGMGSLVMGNGNTVDYFSTMSFVSGFENYSKGVENFIHGYQNNVSSNSLLGLNFALGGENQISQTGSLLAQGLNFSLGSNNSIENEGDAGVNYALGIDNLIENSSETGGNFAMGIGNDILYENTNGSGLNFAFGYANKIGVIGSGGGSSGGTPGMNFVTGIANQIEGESAACFGWGAGLGFNNTFGSFSIGLSGGIANGTGSATYLQNDIPKSLMVGFGDDPTLFVKNGHVGINTTTESSALYVNSETGAYGYSTILGVVNDYTKAFAVHKNDGSTTSENFRIYGNGETNISVDENVKAFSVSRRGSSSTVDNFTVNGNGEVEAKRIKIGDVTTPSSSDYTLYVEKGVLAERLKCALKSTSDWSDFVFDDCYELKSLNEVEEYIKKNKHLPDVPSAEQMVETGLDVAKTNAILLRKIEELTLYVIELKKQMND